MRLGLVKVVLDCLNVFLKLPVLFVELLVLRVQNKCPVVDTWQVHAIDELIDLVGPLLVLDDELLKFDLSVCELLESELVIVHELVKLVHVLVTVVHVGSHGRSGATRGRLASECVPAFLDISSADVFVGLCNGIHSTHCVHLFSLLVGRMVVE